MCGKVEFMFTRLNPYVYYRQKAKEQEVLETHLKPNLPEASRSPWGEQHGTLVSGKPREERNPGWNIEEAALLLPSYPFCLTQSRKTANFI